MASEEHIEVNAVKCLLCGDIIESMYRHDFKWCRCRNVAVDGGHDYVKRSYEKQGTWEEITTRAELDKLKEADCAKQD